MDKEKILRILRILNIQEEQDIRKEIYDIMYPGPFYHIIKKNKELGRDVREFDDDRDFIWRKEETDTQFYYCKHWGCYFEWEEEELEEELEGRDLEHIPGCKGPSKCSNLDYLLRCLDEYFRDKYKEEYKYAIGIVWAYEKNKSLITKGSDIIEMFDKWKENKDNHYCKIYKWWIFYNNVIRNIVANLIVDSMLEKEFDSIDTLGYKLKKEEVNE